ncbi:hypothetical protein RB595_003995 [Gaeumannomyces hyphopodioides]
MDGQITETRGPPPVLGAAWRQGPAIRVRRYGQNDFERFDEETARGSHLCVGYETLGKVNIDCKYHWTRSQWGVLNRHQGRIPAGVVYMDLAFHQPAGYWLEHATVYITLGEDDMSSYALARNRKRRSRKGRHDSQSSEYAVQMTSCGPSIISGEKTYRSEAKTTSFTPTVGAAGFEFGGVGQQSTSIQDRSGSWTFRGAICRPEGRSGLRTLRWDLAENALTPDQPHRREYKTAFAFEHSRRPVYMRVEIEGRLRSKSHGAAHSLARFSSSMAGHKDHSTLTHMDFGGRAVSTRRLNDIVDGLDMAMQMENDNPVHEVRDPTQARFFQEHQSLTPPPAHHPLGGRDGRGGSRGRAGESDAFLLTALRGPLDGYQPAPSTAPSHLGFSELGQRYRAESTVGDDADTGSTTAVNSEFLTAAAAPKTPTPSSSSFEAQRDELLQHPGVVILVRLILWISSVIKWLAQNTSLSSSPLSLPQPQPQPEPGTPWKQDRMLEPAPRPPPKPIYGAEAAPPPGLETLGVRRRNEGEQSHVLRRALGGSLTPASDPRGWSSA